MRGRIVGAEGRRRDRDGIVKYTRLVGINWREP